MINVTWTDIDHRANIIARQIKANFQDIQNICIYPVPRGGIFAAQAVIAALKIHYDMNARLVEYPGFAACIIDDIIDSGDTMKDHCDKYNLPFYALYDQRTETNPEWLSLPWERMSAEQGIEDNITRILQFIGEDVDREGLVETPDRVARSFKKLYGGYLLNPKDCIKIFEDDVCDEMVLLKNIEFYSTCEHHMLPFYGKAHIAYLPNKKVVGISKLARILEIFARRLQIQERLCQNVTETLTELLNPIGAACVIEAQHFCMTARGVEKQNSIMVTSSLTGAFKTKNEARAEFMSMIK